MNNANEFAYMFTALAALFVAYVLFLKTARTNPGGAKLIELTMLVRKEALVRLGKRYTIAWRIFAVASVVVVGLAVAGKVPPPAIFFFLIGGIASWIGGRFGALAALFAINRATHAGRDSLGKAYAVSIRAGMISGLFSIGLALFTITTGFAFLNYASTHLIDESGVCKFSGICVGRLDLQLISIILLFIGLGSACFNVTSRIGMLMSRRKSEAGEAADELAGAISAQARRIEDVQALFTVTILGAIYLNAIALQCDFELSSLYSVLPLQIAASGLAASIVGYLCIFANDKSSPQVLRSFLAMFSLFAVIPPVAWAFFARPAIADPKANFLFYCMLAVGIISSASAMLALGSSAFISKCAGRYAKLSDQDQTVSERTSALETVLAPFRFAPRIVMAVSVLFWLISLVIACGPKT